jgi:hypothetical protein
MDLTSHPAVRFDSWRGKLALFFVSMLLCAVGTELAARAFWRLCCRVPFRDPGRVLYAYYPELRSVDTERPALNDKFYDILFLGGSVLNRNWGSVENELSEQMAYAGHRNVRIFNLATPAHSSRDSWLKYAALGEARFELVVLYDGINEARADNAPPEIFRQDYAHYSWYEIVNALAPYHGTTSFALPYTLRYLAVRLRQVLRSDRYVPKHEPRKDWVQYGQNPRSAVSFEQNLKAVLDLAARRGDRALVMTFATYVPANYSRDAFKENRLDYVRHVVPIESWGRPEYVLATVGVHNEVVRSLAAQRAGVLFVDQARLMAGSARYFNDVCHFTGFGSAKFVENLLEVLLPTLKSG